MSDTFDTAIAAIDALAYGKLAFFEPGMTDEQERAACEHNMAIVMAYGAAQKALLADIETAFPDRSAGAIWRRAYRRSITEGRAEKSRSWKARALGLNPDRGHNAIALSGIAPLEFEDRWVLAVAIPQPAPTNDMGFNIEDVILIDPKSGKAELMFDHGATHYAPPIGMVDRITVETDAKAWARAIALERLEWWQLLKHRRHIMKAEPTWNGWPETGLMFAPPEKVRWSDFSGSIIQVPAEMRQKVNRAILAQANLPRVEGRA